MVLPSPSLIPEEHGTRELSGLRPTGAPERARALTGPSTVLPILATADALYFINHFISTIITEIILSTMDEYLAIFDKRLANIPAELSYPPSVSS